MEATRLIIISRKIGHLLKFTKNKENTDIMSWLIQYTNVINQNDFDLNNNSHNLSDKINIIVPAMCGNGLVEEAKEFIKLLYSWNTIESLDISLSPQELKNFNKLKKLYELL